MLKIDCNWLHRLIVVEYVPNIKLVELLFVGIYNNINPFQFAYYYYCSFFFCFRFWIQKLSVSIFFLFLVSSADFRVRVLYYFYANMRRITFLYILVVSGLRTMLRVLSYMRRGGLVQIEKALYIHVILCLWHLYRDSDASE